MNMNTIFREHFLGMLSVLLDWSLSISIVCLVILAAMICLDLIMVRLSHKRLLNPRFHLRFRIKAIARLAAPVLNEIMMRLGAPHRFGSQKIQRTP